MDKPSDIEIRIEPEPPKLLFVGKVRELIRGQGSSNFDTATQGCGSPGSLGEEDPRCQ